MKQVVVASENPVKIQAVQKALKALFPENSLEVSGIPSVSGVSEQPATDEETFKGAMNRMHYARKHAPEAACWIGIEGGIDYHEGMAEAFAWIVASDGEQLGKARSCSFQLPRQVDALLKQGYELGIANDMVFSEADSKRKGGAVGSLTNGAVSRTDLYVQPVKLAMIPMLKPRLFAASEHVGINKH